MANKKCKFQDDWLEVPLFNGVIEKSKNNNFAAFCTLCCKEINLSNMGKPALMSHLRGKKHLVRVAAKTKSYGIRIFTSHFKVNNYTC